jgi:four helix bundle protein
MNLESYRDLVAWQKAIDLCDLVYEMTVNFPSCELYGLTSQLRRAAVSVPSNIAEGAGRITTGEFVQSVGYARGSLHEVETQVIIARRRRYLAESDAQEFFSLSEDVGRLINGLIRALQRGPSSSGTSPV